MDSENNYGEMASTAFEQLLNAFDIKSVIVHEKRALKFSTTDPASLLAALSQIHDKLYRAILLLHITTMQTDDKVAEIKLYREFVNNYLDISTKELIEMVEAGKPTGVALGLVE